MAAVATPRSKRWRGSSRRVHLPPREATGNAPHLVNDGEPSNKPNANTRHTGSNRPFTVVPASNKPLD